MNRFFFAPEHPCLLACLRVGLGVILLCETAARWPHATELYSTLGPAMPAFPHSAPEDLAEPGAARPRVVRAAPADAPALRVPVPGPVAAVLVDSALLFCLLAVVLGWHTRASLLLAFAGLLWLVPLDMSVSFGKHTVIALQMLVLLACSACGRLLSLDAWLFPGGPPLGCRWPRRLLQLLVCFVYLGAAITKIKTPHFAHGDLLQYSLLDDAWGGGALGHWLARQPRLVPLASLLTILLELAFPLLVWFARWRYAMLLLAAGMHAAMGLALHVGTFTPIMLVLLASFIEPVHLQRVVPRLFAAATVPSRAASAPVSPALAARLKSFLLYLALGAGFAGAGLAVQWHLLELGDQIHGPTPPLHELTREELEPMLRAALPAYEDYVHRVALGQRASFNQVFGSATRFAIGDRLQVLVQFMVPHPPVTLQGILLAPDGSEAGRFTHRVEAAVTHALNGFLLDRALPTGQYTLVIDVQGEEVARRAVQVGR